jgi:hypothetical protein
LCGGCPIHFFFSSPDLFAQMSARLPLPNISSASLPRSIRSLFDRSVVYFIPISARFRSQNPQWGRYHEMVTATRPKMMKSNASRGGITWGCGNGSYSRSSWLGSR